MADDPSGTSITAIRIDREACMGSGNCMFWAPGVFDLDGEGIAVVADPGAATEDRIRLAEQNCPTNAIIREPRVLAETERSEG